MAKKRIAAADTAREGRAGGPVETDVTASAAADAAAVAMTAAAGAAGAKPRRKPLRVGDTAADAAVSGGGADAAVAAEAAGVAGAAENDSTDLAHSAVVGEVVDKQCEKADVIAVSGVVKSTKKKGGGKQKGAPKTGGRKKGTPNIVTADTRQAIRQAWQDYVSTGRFRDDLEELSGYDRLVLMERLVGYTVPKLKSIDLDAKVEQRVTIEDRLRQLAVEEE